MAKLNLRSSGDDGSTTTFTDTDPPLCEADVVNALREIHLSKSPTVNDAIQKCHDLFERVRPKHDQLREAAWQEIYFWLQYLTKRASQVTDDHREMLSQLEKSVKDYQRLHQLKIKKKPHIQFTTLPKRIGQHWEGDIEDVLPPMYKPEGYFSRQCLQHLLRVCVSVSKEEVNRKLLVHINERAAQTERRRWIRRSKVKPGDFNDLWPQSPKPMKPRESASIPRRKTYSDGMDHGKREKDPALLGSKRRRAQSSVITGRITIPSKRKKANNATSTTVMNESDDFGDSSAMSEVADDDSSDIEASHDFDASVESDEGDEQARAPLREIQDTNNEVSQVDADIVAEVLEVPNVGEAKSVEGLEPMQWSPLTMFSDASSLVELEELFQPKASKAPPRQTHDDKEQLTKRSDQPPTSYSPPFERNIPRSNDNHIPEQKPRDSLALDSQLRDDCQTRPFRDSPSTQQNRQKHTSSEDQSPATSPPCVHAMGDVTSENAPLPTRSSPYRSAFSKGSPGSMDQGKLGSPLGHPGSQPKESEVSEHGIQTSKTRGATRIQEVATSSKQQTAQSTVYCVLKEHSSTSLAPPLGALGSSYTQQLAPVSILPKQRSSLDADASTRGTIESKSLGKGQNLPTSQSSKEMEAGATLANKPESSISHCLTPLSPTPQSHTTSTCEPQIGAPLARSPRVPKQSQKAPTTLRSATAPITDGKFFLPCTSKGAIGGISKINPVDITKDTEQDRCSERPISISSADRTGSQALDSVAYATQASSLAERAEKHSREALTGEEIIEEMARQDSFRHRVVKTLSHKLKNLETSEFALRAAKVKARQLHIISDNSREYNDKVRKLQEWGEVIKAYHNALDGLGTADQTIRCQILAKKQGVEAERRQLEMEMDFLGQTAAKTELDRAEAECQKAQKCLRDVCQPLIGLKGSYALWSASGSRIYDLMTTCQEVLGATGEMN